MSLNEAALGRIVVQGLLAEEWDVYQEVEAFGRRADIVALRDPIVMVVELKTCVSFDLLEQCCRWVGYAHNVVACVPPTRGGAMAARVFGAFGIGLWSAALVGSRSPRCEFQVRASPAFDRRADVKSLRSKLRPQHRHVLAAGSPAGGQWTAFKETCEHLRDCVKKSPGIDLKSAINSIKHHYASSQSARASIVKRIEDGTIRGLRLERVGKRLCLFPEKSNG